MGMRINRPRVALTAGLLGLAAGVMCGDRARTLAQAPAQPLPMQVQTQAAPLSAPAASSDYAKRVVAYIYGTIPITREELGEYLIARLGASRLENLVNKKIIEHHCREKGITVEAAEVDAALQEDLKGLNVTQKDFVDRVLKQYKKTLYEWKEDVIRPRLLMTRLVRGQIKAEQDEIQKAFAAYYGPKVDCRIILWEKGQLEQMKKIWPQLRDDAEFFDREARKQPSPRLAMVGGQITPIGHYTTGNEDMEKKAFGLKPGEVSEIIGTPEGPLVLKCVKHIPAVKDKKLEDVRADLEKEVIEKKIHLEIPRVFAKLREEAAPKLFLKDKDSLEDLIRDVRQELQQATTPSPAPEKK